MRAILIMLTLAATLIAAPSLVLAQDQQNTTSNAAMTKSNIATQAKHCNPNKSKPCGRSCIALSKVCHK